jgi:hypothetical protein
LNGFTQLRHAYHTLDALCRCNKTVVIFDLIQIGERRRPRCLSKIEHVAKDSCIDSAMCIVHLKYVQSENPHFMGAYASTGPLAHCDTAVHPAAPDPPPHCLPYPELASSPGPVTAPRPFLQEATETSCLAHPCAPSRAKSRGIRRRFRSCNILVNGSSQRDIHVPSLSRKTRSRTTPHTRFAEENHLLVLRGLREAEPILELFCV